MRQIVILTICSLLFWGCSGETPKNALRSRSEQELLASYLDYHQKKDLAGILGLFYLKDTPPFVIDSVKQRLLKNFELTLSSSRIEEIPPGKLARVMAGFPYNDKILVPNLQPLKQITFKYEPAGQNEELRTTGSSIMFGKIADVCYFTLSKEKEAPAK
jgi:hypothetical protein